MANGKKKECPPVGAPLWMATFGDMMSLLLTFFILLVSFSSMQESKFEQAVGSLKGALGMLESMPTIPIHRDVLIPKGSEETKTSDERGRESNEDALAASLESLRERVVALNQEDVTNISRSDQGVAIRLEDSTMFKPGGTEILPSAYVILDEVWEVLMTYPNPVRIVGHTDNVRTSSSVYPSNWELSAARAAAVLRYFQAEGLDPRRMGATGMGEWQPVVKNNSAKNRAKNRRVEIFMDIKTERAGIRLGEHY